MTTSPVRKLSRSAAISDSGSSRKRRRGGGSGVSGGSRWVGPPVRCSCRQCKDARGHIRQCRTAGGRPPSAGQPAKFAGDRGRRAARCSAPARCWPRASGPPVSSKIRASRNGVTALAAMPCASASASALLDQRARALRPGSRRLAGSGSRPAARPAAPAPRASGGRAAISAGAVHAQRRGQAGVARPEGGKRVLAYGDDRHAQRLQHLERLRQVEDRLRARRDHRDRRLRQLAAGRPRRRSVRSAPRCTPPMPPVAKTSIPGRCARDHRRRDRRRPRAAARPGRRRGRRATAWPRPAPGPARSSWSGVEADVQPALDHRDGRRHGAGGADLGLDRPGGLDVLRPGHAVGDDRRFQRHDGPAARPAPRAPRPARDRGRAVMRGPLPTRARPRRRSARASAASRSAPGTSAAMCAAMKVSPAPVTRVTSTSGGAAVPGRRPRPASAAVPPAVGDQRPRRAPRDQRRARRRGASGNAALAEQAPPPRG